MAENISIKNRDKLSITDQHKASISRRHIVNIVDQQAGIKCAAKLAGLTGVKPVSMTDFLSIY